MGRTLDGKVAIVTGAGSGVGQGVAILLAAEGASVVAVDPSGAEATRTTAGAQSRIAASSEPGTSDDSARAIVHDALTRFGRVDILVNAAHAARHAPLTDLTEDDWDVVFEAYVRGSFCMTRAAAAPMRAQRSGRIVHLGSAAGLFGAAGQANYAAATGAIAQFSRLVAVELRDSEVTSNCVAITAATLSAVDGGPRPEDGEHPHDVAPFIAYLCTDAAAAITGQTFLAGGGAVSLISNPAPAASMTNLTGKWTPREIARAFPHALGAAR